jgi:hypothetical protein
MWAELPIVGCAIPCARNALTAASGCLLVWCILALPALSSERTTDIRDFGAKPDGKTLCSDAVQKAIDRAAGQGGGTVVVPPGTWLCSTVCLASHITLQLEAGAVLMGSRNRDDYLRAKKPSDGESSHAARSWSLIAGEGLEDIGIVGPGTIDVQGDAFRVKEGNRPKGIHLVDCRDVRVENINMRNAGSWMQHYRGCERLAIRGVRVFNHVAYNNDGMNIDSCRDVTISDCRIDSDDDGLVLKSLSLRPCENVTVSNCVVSSHCNAIKMGTESAGGFKNITISNCAVQSPQKTKHTYGRDRGLAGIALEIVDGGTLERVTISNIAIQGVSVPIFMRLGNRARQYEGMEEKPGMGTFRQVILSNIVATGVSPVGCSITGLPGCPIEGVTLSNIRLGFEGGGTCEDAARQIAERPDAYPESTMFGTLPAYGFYCRHVKDLVFDQIALRTEARDLRPAMVFDDAEGLTLEGLDAAWAKGGAAMVRLTNVRDAMIRGCQPAAETFLDVAGNSSRGIVLLENDLSRVKSPANVATEVPVKAVLQPGR